MHNRFRTKHPDADQPRAFVEAYTQPGISFKRQIQVLQRRGRANGVTTTGWFGRNSHDR